MRMEYFARLLNGFKVTGIRLLNAWTVSPFFFSVKMKSHYFSIKTPGKSSHKESELNTVTRILKANINRCGQVKPRVNARENNFYTFSPLQQCRNDELQPATTNYVYGILRVCLYSFSWLRSEYQRYHLCFSTMLASSHWIQDQ